MMGFHSAEGGTPFGCLASPGPQGKLLVPYDFIAKKNPPRERWVFIVPKAGLEPAYLAAHAPETCVSTNSTTSAKNNFRFHASNFNSKYEI